MKKIVISLVVVVAIFALGFIAFQTIEELPAPDPDIQGFIFAFDDNGRILVAEGLSEGSAEYTGELEELEGNAIWFAIDENTTILDEQGRTIEASDLALHQGVEVWSEGPMLLSYPAQGGASRIVLTGRVFGEEEVVASACELSDARRKFVIRAIESDWSELQEDISIATEGNWNEPSHYQFLGNERVLISFDEGHIMPMGIVEFDCIEGASQNFRFIADDIGVPDGFPFRSQELWREVVENYGHVDFQPRTYIRTEIISGEIFELEEWTETSENVFVR